MNKKIKNKAILFFQLLCGIVLIGIISDWFLSYSDETNQIISIALFSLIGVGYIAFAWAIDRKILRMILLVCGIYLIVMNFFNDSALRSVLTITGVLIPLLIGKFLPEKEEEENPVLD